jgi:hypothetical protein
MHFGGAMFFTDYSMSAPELARALEERGFESVWAPRTSRCRARRRFRGAAICRNRTTTP